MDLRLLSVDPIIAKVVDGQNLTAEESQKAFTAIFLYDTSGYHLAVFIAALHAKGETVDELLGLINAQKKLAAPLMLQHLSSRAITDLSGTGGGSFKTINVSTAASFVVAAAGYKVGKAAYFGITSPTGSADIFSAFGIDIMKLPKSGIEEAIEKVGIAPFCILFFSPKLSNRAKISRKLFGEEKLHIRTPFHLVTNAFSPFPLKHRIYGCYSKKYLPILAELFAKMGFERTLTFSSDIGIAEISNVGRTIVFEQNGKKIRRYALTPEELGIQEAKAKDIASGSREENIKDFVRILKGKGTAAKSDLVAINAGAALYSLKDVKSIQKGVNKALQILQSGSAYQVLENLVNEVGIRAG